jgi:hypothetical protein
MVILPRIGLSRKKHLPCLWFNKRSFYPHEFFRLIRHGLNWSAMRNDGDSVQLIHRKGFSFYAHEAYANMLLNEWIEWEKVYKAPFSLKGKTVLDVGAGCGETALFYFLKGAEKVICVESNPMCGSYLEKNRAFNNWNMEIYLEPFKLEHLTLNFDLCKMDIEGGEKDLLLLDRIDFPLCLEVHGKVLLEAFSKLGFIKVVEWKKRETAIMNNYR